MAANATGFDAQANLGSGVQSYTADSGAVVKSGTSNSLAATFGAVGPVGNTTQPTITRAKYWFSASNLSASTVIGLIEITLQDATPVIQYVDVIPASTSATAVQGIEIVGEIFIGQGTGMAQNIVTVTVTCAMSGGTHTATQQLRVMGYP